jgi:FAD dependent oxidoreductase TIGR03364
VLSAAGLWHKRTGSLHLAYREDEARVLREFIAAGAGRGEPFEWLEPARVRTVAPLVKQEGLLGGMWSPDEVCVDPREVVAGLPGWLERELGAEFRFEDPVTGVGAGSVVATSGSIEAGRTWICSGDELRVLFPELLSQSGLVRCKFQMMRSVPCEPEMSVGPMLAGGLTLRHYSAFRDCRSLAALKERVARESPSFDRLGIHVMVSQNGLGELTIGDSQEYGDEIGPFDKAEIDELILDYLRRFLDIPGLRIASRWHGTYAKHPVQPYLVLGPLPGVLIVTGVGGAGMTLSFGLVSAVVDQALESE